MAHRRTVAELVVLVPPSAAHDCMAVLDGPPILYLAAGACPASRFAFPGHLLFATEGRALGADRGVEIDRLFARRPAAIVLGDAPYGAEPERLAQVRRRLHAGYSRAGSVEFAGAPIVVWARR